ncbi:hypothetical protein C2L65_42165 [Paraburkholderia terrae]|uniref:Uncharacterized protein n=1 Tax=Paraburkholderia terrae TaxID=311230 RepID=A0A2I8F460_9BURK|nr:hypothetical protein C2L65_42165 [Paraburkholderia terrae]
MSVGTGFEHECGSGQTTSVTMVMKISAIAWMAVLATYSPGVCSRTAASLVVHQTKEFIQLCVCIMT